MQWENLDWEVAEEYSLKLSRFARSERDCQFYYGIVDGRRVVKKEYSIERAVFTGGLPEKLSLDSMYKEFKREFDVMTRIEEDTRNNSKSYPFPHYHACNIGRFPCIIMENIEPPFELLEQRLQNCTGGNPYGAGADRFQRECVFGSENLLKIIQQLNVALRLLYEHGILYLDLQPENVLIDDRYNLKLVDLTWCFNLESYKKSPDDYHNYKIPESRRVFWEEKDPAILICRAFGHFIARLHYRGAYAYNSYFDSDIDTFTGTYPNIFGDLIPKGNLDSMLESLRIIKRKNPNCSVLTLYETAYLKLEQKLKEDLGKI